MSYHDSFGQSSARSYQNSNLGQGQGQGQVLPSSITASPNFDILDWHPAYQSCQRYFLDHAQHEPGTQALCALINIRLPFQWRINPLYSSQAAAPNSNQQSAQQSPYSTFQPSWNQRSTQSPSSRGGSGGSTSQSNGSNNNNNQQQPPVFVSLIPYVRRLVITGFDKPGILHGFFGDAFGTAIPPLQDCERRNYLFAAKHGGWRSCKKQYDAEGGETVPFLRPLENVKMEELEAADKQWSAWLAMEDWMIGPRAPGDDEGGRHRRDERGAMSMGGDMGFGNMPDGVESHVGRG